MRFPYYKFNLLKPSKIFGTLVLKPIIPIKIFYGDRGVQYTALIDSGADFCVFDAEIGEYLGIDIKSGFIEKFRGVQNKDKAIAYFHKIDIEIGGRRYNILAGFSYDIAKHGYGVVGQKGFFDNFIVKFDLLKEEIELKERQK